MIAPIRWRWRRPRDRHWPYCPTALTRSCPAKACTSGNGYCRYTSACYRHSHDCRYQYPGKMRFPAGIAPESARWLLWFAGVASRPPAGQNPDLGPALNPSATVETDAELACYRHWWRCSAPARTDGMPAHPYWSQVFSECASSLL